MTVQTFATIAPVSPDVTVATSGRTRATPRALKTKKPRKSRRKYDLTPQFLSQYFHLPQKEAAKHIGVAVITVKRNCKRYNFAWPYRAMKNKSKAVMSNKAVAFHYLPLLCMAESDSELSDESDCAMIAEDNMSISGEKSESECDTDTESVEDVEHDVGHVLMSLHKVQFSDFRAEKMEM